MMMNPPVPTSAFEKSVALWGSPALWLDLLDLMGIGVVLYSPEGGRIQDNECARKFLGDEERVTLPDLTESLYERVFDGDVGAELMELLNPGKETIPGGQKEFTEIVEGKEDRILQVRLVPGERGQTAAFLFDITRLYRRHGQILRLSRQHRALLQAIDVADIGVILFDPWADGQPIEFVNQVVCDLMESKRSLILGMDWRVLLPEGDLPPDQTRMIYPTKDGKRQSWGVQMSIQGEWGMVFLTDMTRLVEQEEQLLHAQKLDSLGQMAGGIAHDFNNILGIIRGYAQMVQKRVKEDPLLAPQMESIVQACLRGAALTERLLLFSRRQIADTTTCPLQKTIGQLEGMITPLLPPSVELQICLPGEDITLGFSVDHLTQVLMNLIINARDAMPDGGTVRIEGVLVTKEEEIATLWPEAKPGQIYLQLQVSDEGTGIPDNIRQKIFEPFFTTKEPGKGTGLGLSVVFGLVRQHQGGITLHSEMGVGTCFTLWLPVVEIGHADADATPSDSEAEEKNADLTGLNIMVVDDEPESRALIAQAFSEKGGRVLVAGDGQQALYMQDDFEGRIDVLVSDVAMPDLDGFHLARLWRDIRPESRIVLVSGYPKGEENGNPAEDAFLAKPLDFEELSRTLAGLCQGGTLTKTSRVWVRSS